MRRNELGHLHRERAQHFNSEFEHQRRQAAQKALELEIKTKQAEAEALVAKKAEDAITRAKNKLTKVFVRECRCVHAMYVYLWSWLCKAANMEKRRVLQDQRKALSANSLNQRQSVLLLQEE